MNKIKKYIIYILAAYAILGFIILPLVLKPQLIKLVQAQLKATISCESITFNPFIFKLALHNVVLQNLQKEKLVTFDTLRVDLEAYSLVMGTIHLKEIALIRPKVYLAYEADKTLNVLNILQIKEGVVEEKDSSTTLPRVIINKLVIVDGQLNYTDFTLKNAFHFAFNRIAFKLVDIDTAAFTGSDAKLRFHTNLGDGGFFDFKSQVLGFSPFIVKGNITFEASKLYTEWKYLQDNLNLEVADGKISFSADYSLNLDDLNATKIYNLNLAVDKLRIKPKDKYKDVLNLEHACLSDATILPMQKNIQIGKLCLKGLDLKVKRSEDGKIDWLGYIKTKFASESTQKKVHNENKQDKKKVEPWNVLVKDVKFEEIGVEFLDKAIAPKVTTKLNELNFYAKNITLEGSKPVSYKMNLLLNDEFNCKASGTIIHKQLDVKTDMRCSNFDLVHYKPYIDKAAKSELAVYDIDLKKGLVDFDIHAQIKDENGSYFIFAKDTNLTLKQVSLNKASTREKIFALKSLNLSGIFVDTLKQKVGLSLVAVNGFDLRARRYKNKSINLEKLIVAKKNTSRKKKLKTLKRKNKPYAVNVKHFALNNAKISFDDKGIKKETKSTLDRIKLHAYNIDLKEKTWLKYKFSMRVNKKGYVKSNGKLRHTPLKQKGTLALQKISLTELTPYIQEKAFVNIEDGTISLKTKTSYAKSTKKPDLMLNGSFEMDNLYAVDSRNNDPLLAFSKINLKTFTFELAPNRLYVDEVDIGSFYVDVLIDKQKKMNFSKVIKHQEKDTTKVEEKTSQDEKKVDKEPAFPVKIVKVIIDEGNAKFADLSIPIEFRTNIHNLNGAVYSVSNIPGEITQIDISGEVDDYGSTKLKGSLNAANPKKFTDLDFNFKNLEMNSFSGYSASFAGHEIDGGKLYLSLAYKINNANLYGDNSILIKQMKLGKENEDKNVTKLPLGFVIALLEDSDGVIDIDMPVEGNIDEPDFKYGTLVWKTLGGLIAKAVTSPFKFLGSMMGIDGDALEFAEFEAGSAVILPTEREKLDNIVKMMIKRPKIDLGLAPTYDELSDKKAMQLGKLIDIVVARSGIKNKKDHKSAMTIDMLEDIYEDLRDDDALDLLQSKLKEQYPDKEKYNRAYLIALENLDASLQVVSQKELIALANKRVDTMIHYLTEVKAMDKTRITKLVLQKINGSKNNFVQMKLQIEVK